MRVQGVGLFKPVMVLVVVVVVVVGGGGGGRGESSSGRCSRWLLRRRAPRCHFDGGVTRWWRSQEHWRQHRSLDLLVHPHT